MVGPDRVHASARGFDRAADAYERGRPEYPPEALRYLARALALEPGRTVVDLGAGTGKLTRGLLPFGVRVVAIEPSEGMRARFRKTVGWEARDGVAEAIPLPRATVDAVVVGQAFHWFKAAAALREIGRILTPTGGLGLLWNRRDESVPWMARFGEILHGLDRHGAPESRGTAWRSAFDAVQEFGPIEERSFPWVRRVTPQEVVDRTISVSFVAVEPEAVRNEVVRRVQTLLNEDPNTRGRPVVDFPYRCDVYVTHRRGPMPSSLASHPGRHRQRAHFAGLGSARPS